MTQQSIDYESSSGVTYTAYGSSNRDGGFDIERVEVRDSIDNIWSDIDGSSLGDYIQSACDRETAKEAEDEALLRSQCKSDEDYQEL